MMKIVGILGWMTVLAIVLCAAFSVELNWLGAALSLIVGTFLGIIYGPTPSRTEEDNE